jgi:hypothetical protein
LAGAGFVQHAAEGKDVSATIDVSTGDLLRRHVCELAFDLTGLGGRVDLPPCFGDPEVRQPHLPRRRNQDVLRRDIAMNDVQRMPIIVEQFMRRM